TITALIANALAQGKTVLFVAEKMAALEVVQKRLEKIGIAPFCLELHSNKARKKAVLEQLRRATEVTKEQPPEAYARRAEQLSALRKELDAYAVALHRRTPSGLSLYQLVSRYETVRDAEDLPPLPAPFAATATPALLDRQQSLLEQLTAAARAVGHPADHPLEPVGSEVYSQQLKTALPPAISDYAAALERTASAAEQLAEALGEPAPSTFSALRRMAETAAELVLWQQLPRVWAGEDCERRLGDIAVMASQYEKAAALRRDLAARWQEGFFRLPGQQLFLSHSENAGKWLVPRTMGLGRLSRQVAAFAKGTVDRAALGREFQKLAEYQEKKAAGDALFARRGQELDFLDKGEQTDWAEIARLVELARASALRLRTLTGSDAARIRHGGVPALGGPLADLTAAWEQLLPAKNTLYQLLSVREHEGDGWADSQRRLCATLQDSADTLRDWITWNSAAREAEEGGLQNVVAACRQGLALEALIPAWQKNVCQALITAAIAADPALDRFSGTVFREKVEQLKRMDSEIISLTREELYCRLAARVPSFAREAAQSSELGILQRAIRSGGRGVSLRRIFEQLPTLLPRLVPCLLMSPISAAQYLEPGREPFDLVVFDEASQLPTCKAVGALARGREAVIVGDPKQMPPTSFFATGTSEEEMSEMEDLESILDDCLALRLPESHLLWHYRSRHESLISFSNSRFYENRLFTFPSVNDRQSKVTLRLVDGVFERGRSRHNRAEAEAVVAELIRRSRDRELSRFSVGVVTFNIPQQHLIDDLLAEACRADPALEQWAFGGEEPLFIKNLENVQGDERDVILFSIGYGPDEEGKVSMNFGPLNRDGGWRRLNVAVSRARQEMVVFSSMTPDRINLSRTGAEGVAALKAFLEYAAGSRLALDDNTARRQRSRETGIARAICRELERRGYRTQQNVGRSEFRVDIGVVDPRDEDRYLLGILLDGEAYGSARTTRDREIAQIAVLEGLGWQIHRLFTMDWWDNSKKELARILERLEQAELAADRPAPDASEPPPPPPKTAEAKPAPRPQAVAPVYQPALLKEELLTTEEFLLPARSADIGRKVLQVIAQEAPVSEALLTRRLLQSCGIARAGSRIQSRLAELYHALGLKRTTGEGAIFYWRADQDPAAYRLYRVAGSGEARRELRDIPVQELRNAACTVLSEQFSMLPEDLLRETARKLGYTRLGGHVTAAITTALTLAREQGDITEAANGLLTLTEQGAARAAETAEAVEGTAGQEGQPQ
ncbi:MAG: DUF3320 domain-containing protein, partial [Clostridia bacterium]|nr:DUF3320 domain-containing protein [Clostridia bacterium]